MGSSCLSAAPSPSRPPPRERAPWDKGFYFTGRQREGRHADKQPQRALAGQSDGAAGPRAGVLERWTPGASDTWLHLLTAQSCPPTELEDTPGPPRRPSWASVHSPRQRSQAAGWTGPTSALEHRAARREPAGTSMASAHH